MPATEMTATQTMNELAIQRKFIWKLYGVWMAELTKITSDLKTLQEAHSYSHGPGSQMFEETETERRQKEENVTKMDRLYERHDTIRWCFKTLESTFGPQVVEHAIEEGQERIGNLPYVKE